MKRFLLLCVAVSFFLVNEAFSQERTVSGTVTAEDNGSAVPGVNVILKGTTVGTVTDIDGKYKLEVPAEGGTLVFSFIGLATKEAIIGNRSVIDMVMTAEIRELNEIVVTALNISREAKTLPYAAQQVNSDELNITQNTDVKSAIMGKIAGVSLAGQAGSKLGQFGKIRIRGAISLTKDSDPLYVVDGVPTPDPNDIDMNNIASINVLKGPNATALYGQRAEAGVIILTTKTGKRKGISVELMNSTTWDKVAYLPKLQNLYGGGYEGDASFGTFDFNGGAGPYGDYLPQWSALNGKRYLLYDNNYADESWGPKFDGKDYVPWYAWWPDSKYFGQTAKYVAQTNNIKDFYQTGVSPKTTVAVSTGGDNYSARVAYTYLDQKGITPYTDYKKHYFLTNLDYKVLKNLKITTNIRYATSKTKGDYNDDYANQTSGSFNQWFNRNLEMDKLYEERNLMTPQGYTASWNWWGPDYWTLGGGFQKPAFWYDHYTFMENYDQTRLNTNFVGNIKAAYQITDDLNVDVLASTNSTEYKYDWYFPFVLSNSAAPELYNAWSNSFGKYRRTTVENNYAANLRYKKNFGDVDLTALLGGNIRTNNYKRFESQMDVGAKTGGLIIPDLYTFSNAGIVPVAQTYEYQKQVNSLYGNLSVGYKGLVYLDGSYRKDWSSALPASSNGYAYPSIGASFIFSDLLNSSNVLSFGKLRASWAQVGSDVDALKISSIYATGAQPFMGDKILMYAPTELVDPNIKPALNTSVEAGFDLRFFTDRIGLNFTYYKENRKDDIIPISISRGSGYNTYLTNAGEVSRNGIEVALNADVLKFASGFTWNLAFNIGTYNTVVNSLPGDLKAISGVEARTNAFNFVSVINELGDKWGQLRGTAIARDDAGNPIIQSNGLYKTEADQYLGSILPDYSGGLINTFTYKGFQLAVSIDYQKGGKFFSLTEQWGEYSGLMEETASMNDKGHNVRDAVSDGGGVHVVGVSESGSPVDMYVEALDYYKQWYSNRLAEPFIHDKSYIKLREISLNYDFGNLLKAGFIKGATVGVIGRNLALLAVAKDNKNRWDPSELSQNYGEDGQLPGTRSYGVDIKLTF